MEALMGDALGLGLAATQLGVMHRLFIFRVGSDAPLVAVVNPQLEWTSQDQETAEEGCLSLPHVLVDVERPLHVRVKAQDEQGEPIVLEASGLEARVIQHEMDHLDGVLILDHASKEQRKAAMRAMREGGEPARARPRAPAERQRPQRGLAPRADRLPRQLQLRGRGAERARGVAASAGPGRHSPDRPQGPRPQDRAAARGGRSA